MSDQALRALLSTAVEQLRDATDLTTDEVIGLAALPPTMLTPDVCYSLCLLKGAAAALPSCADWRSFAASACRP